MVDRSQEDELERLRRETRALDEQIKLLVQTEQRLSRSQNELDTQLVRIRSLAGFALESSGTESPAGILARAVDVLSRAFSLDWIGVVRLEPSRVGVTLLAAQGRAVESPIPLRLDAASLDWLHALREPVFVTFEPDDGSQPAGAMMRAVAPAMVPEPGAPFTGHVACVPLRDDGTGVPAALVAFAARRRQTYSRLDALAERQLPFLQLLANHVDRAIENANLTEDLRERSAQLASSLAVLEETQRELVQSHKLEAVGRLAGGVAHDFNNLLTVILGYAGELQRGLPLGSPHQEGVRYILEAAERAAVTVRQLLAHGRRQIQRREGFDLAEQTGRTLGLLRKLVGEHIQLDLALDPLPGPILADRSQIEQVILNLVVNARDAMPGGGTMRVLTRPADPSDAARCDGAVDPSRFAVLEVQDTGVGMDAETRSRIFEPFFTTKGPGQGTGLGLAVVYGIVKQSEGHVLVESRVGEGSRFTVLLPLSRAGERVAVTAPAAEPPEVPQGVILVVEDEELIRGVVVATLRKAGHIVMEAADGVAALARLEREPMVPDLLLTDVVMPRLGGAALAATLRRTHPGLRIAFMSGYSEDLRADGVTLAEGTGFLAKPFTPRQLLSFVSTMLAREGATRPR